MSGSYHPEKALPFVEEEMTSEQADIATAILSWCHRSRKTFGHGTIDAVFKEFCERNNIVNDEPEYLHCPFCGQLPRVTKHHKEDVWSLVHRCRVFGAMSIDWTSKEQIAKAWNTRYENAAVNS